MKINEVKINGFGKLTDRTFGFDKGLNVIYGPNEAGKSTLHQFIFAMLYGFYKPYVKRKMMSEAYDRYVPWQSNADYRGSMMVDKGGDVFRIERTFTKGKDDVKVYDAASGTDVTGDFDYSKVYRTYDPARKLTGLNAVGFANTVSISQLSSRTDAELVQEIQDNMSTLASTKQVEISVNNVLKKLDEKAAKIGSGRKKTSKYAKMKDSLVELEAEMKAAREAHEEAFRKKKEEVSVSGRLTELRAKQKVLKEQYASLEHEQYRSTLGAVVKLQERQAILEETLAKTERFAEYKVETAEGFMRRQMELVNLAEREKIQSAELEKMTSQHAVMKEELKEKITSRDLAAEYEVVNDTVGRVEGLDSVISEKETKLDAVTALLNETRASRDALKPSRFVPGIVAGGVVALLAIVLGVVFSRVVLPVVFLVLGGGAAGFFGYRMIRSNEDFKKAKDQIEELSSIRKLSLMDMESDMKMRDRLVADQKCRSIDELREKRDRLYKESILADEYKKRVDELKENMAQMDIDMLEKRTFLKETKTRIVRIQDELEVTEHVYGVKTEEDSRRASMAYQEHMKAKHELGLVKTRIKELLGGMHITDLERKVRETTSINTAGLDLETVNRELQAVSEEILSVAEARSRLTAEIFSIEERHRTVGEIADEMATVKIGLKKMDETLAVTEIISRNIREIAEDMQNDFAPLVNEKMSEIAGKVTGGKYTSLKVNPSMEVKLYDSEADRMVSVEELSSGTIDMVYLALRMGVSDMLSKENALPLILDDCFVQYDDERVRKVLDYISREDRQILLFTCHRREERILDELGVRYKQIEI